MSGWKSVLKNDPTDWLLEEENPSVRYLMLTDVLEVPADAPEARKARDAIMERGAVPQILARQEDGGCWGKPDMFYHAKYRGTSWQLIILAELLADGKDARIKKACEFILENSQDHESGGFSLHRHARAGGGRHSEVIPCLTGNMAWSLVRLGYTHDPRVQRAINWITNYQRFDDATGEAPQGWPYDRFEICWGKHTCHMGVAKALKALSGIPEGERTQDVRRTLEKGVTYFLNHHIHKKSHDLTRVSKPGWLRFGFPLMYQTDVLDVLGILTGLGCRDERMQEAVDLVISKQNASGRWIMANSFNGRFQVDIEEKGRESKWLTLNALRVLKRYTSRLSA